MRLHLDPFWGGTSVGDQIGVEILLHGFDAVVELFPFHDSVVLVEQGSMQPLDEAVGLGPAAVFPAVVAEYGGDPGLMASKVGSTSLFIRCTAVTGSLLGYRRPQA